jgi:hypothetical protein
MDSKRLELAEIWVLISVFFCAAGWGLSFIHELNQAGYLVAIALGIGCVLGLKRALGVSLSPSKLRLHRFRRTLPRFFLLLAILSFLGGALYGPTNYDALSYRIPRTLQWLADGHWSWIHVNDARLNTRPAGFEWLMAPQLLFLRTDRLLFLINFVSFLLLPGLVFQWFTAMGIRRRVAWNWMWLAPSGYCFVLQAASIGNDAFAAVYALGAMVFALRAKRKGSVYDAWLAILAAGMMTGSKGSNLPILLPITVALLPSFRLLCARPFSTGLVSAVSVLVSFLPTAFINIVHCGDWTGAALEQKVFVMPKPLYGIIGNSVQLVIQNFAPPFFPWARYWNDHVDTHSPYWLSHIFTYFESGSMHLGELPMEEGAGLGLGIVALVVLSVIYGARYAARSGNQGEPRRKVSGFLLLLMLLPYVALTAYMMKSGLSAASRIVSPYYSLLLPVFLSGRGQIAVVSRRWWQWLVIISCLVTAVVIIVAPARPLWPALSVMRRLHQSFPNSSMVARAERVYSVYGGRNDSLGRVRALIPVEEKVVGIVSVMDDPLASLWKPYGKRRLMVILPKDSLSELKQKGMRYVVISPDGVKTLFNQTPEEWAAQSSADIVGQTTIDRKAGAGTEVWAVAKLRD